VNRLGEAILRRPWLVLAPVVGALVVLLVAMSRERWYPTGDLGQAELHVRGFLRHPPLVGAAGRIGTIEQQGSHPGPSLWVILYPTYLLFGRSSFGMMAGMVVLHVGAIIGSVLTAWRIGGRWFALAVAVGIGIVVRASGAEFFVEPWNPWAAVLPFLWFVLLVAGTIVGHRWMFLGVLVLGSHCVQAHVGYAVLVGVLSAAALVSLVVSRPPDLVKVVGWSAGAFVVLWLPPLLDQIRRDPGNFTLLWREFGETEEPAIGWWAAFKGFAGEVNLLGDWIGGPGHLPTDAPNWFGFLAMVALFVGGSVVAVRRQDRAAIVLHATVLGGCLIGIASMSRIFGEFYPYVIRWLWMLALLGAVVPIWTILRHVQPLQDRLRPAHGAIGALAAVTVAAVLASVSFARAELPSLRDSRLVGGVVPQVLASLDPAGRYLVRWHDPASLGGVGYGVVLEMERQGWTAGVDPWGAAAALPHRVMPEQTANAVLWVVTGDVAIADFRARNDAVELGYYDQRTESERQESARLRAQLESRLTELGQADLIPALDTQYGLAPFVIGDAPVPQDVKDLAGALNTLRYAIAVFAVPPFSSLYPPPP
jgi:hypothetical protein